MNLEASVNTSRVCIAQCDPYVHVIEVSMKRLLGLGSHARIGTTYILNSAMTSSVLTKLSISGCICRSMYKRLSGRILIGPMSI